MCIQCGRRPDEVDAIAVAGEGEKKEEGDANTEGETTETPAVDQGTTQPRTDPPHKFYGSWEAVQAAKEEFLTKGPYTLNINGQDIKMHHNAAGVEGHTSCMANHLTEELYNKLSQAVTPNGVTLDKCIKTGIENPGHPAIKTVGMSAGDTESYEVFKGLFDPVIDERHGGYSADAVHVSDMDVSKIKDPAIIDASYVVSTRVRSGRNVKVRRRGGGGRKERTSKQPTKQTEKGAKQTNTNTHEQTNKRIKTTLPGYSVPSVLQQGGTSPAGNHRHQGPDQLDR